MQITPEEVQNFTGKFIIQMDCNSDGSIQNGTINNKNWEFIQEKRLSFIVGLTWQGFYYEHKKFNNKEDFADYFNNYLKGYEGQRYHRLLTSKEL